MAENKLFRPEIEEFLSCRKLREKFIHNILLNSIDKKELEMKIVIINSIPSSPNYFSDVIFLAFPFNNTVEGEHFWDSLCSSLLEDENEFMPSFNMN